MYNKYSDVAETWAQNARSLFAVAPRFCTLARITLEL